ncbi:hypothetical protein [Sinomonas terrae]|uniref:Ferritin-like domain-containing protein n=1 Tax=Sinomonas terrae TaxID=2908838 RepID=A0ABS9U5A8_9MICC|nr:hypothetical protein [Sinomonas terrae]MCH6471707.1 hypothetical protein [Sinomonas terrae]
MRIAVYLGLLDRSEQSLAESYRQVAEGHGDEPDIRELTQLLARQCDAHVHALAPIIERYGEAEADDEPERLHADTLSETRSGPVGLIRDLQDLHLLATLAHSSWTMVGQAAEALRDKELHETVQQCSQQLQGQLRWLQTRMKQAAPQALALKG